MSTIAYPCPGCGQSHLFDHAFIATQGGRTHICGECGAPMRLPTLGAAGVKQSRHAGARPVRVRTAPPPPPATVKRGVTPPPIPPPISPASSPASQSDATVPPSGAWHKKGRVFIVSGTQLPHRCVKCNSECDGQREERTVYWHSEFVYFALLLGVLPYFAIAMAIRQEASVEFSLCKKHRRSRRRTIVTGFCLAGAGFLTICASFLPVLREMAGVVPLGIAMTTIGAVISLLSARTLSATRINGNYAWLRGSGSAFRKSLPPGPSTSRATSAPRRHASQVDWRTGRSTG